MPTEETKREPMPRGSVREEFEILLKPVLPLAFRYVARLAEDREVAMDLIQEASLTAFRSFDQFERGTNFRAWFLKILTHKYYRFRQVAGRSSSISLDEAPDLFLFLEAKRRGVPMEGDPSAFVLGKADGEMVCEALTRLAEEYRVVATLHFLSEMSYQECAAVLEIPVGTVRSRLHRARKQLQVSLWQIAEERGYISAREEECH